MSYTIEFKPEVYDDIKVAYDWYEAQRVGLGEDFLLTLEASYAKIIRVPKAIVIAIMHTKRDSSDWTERA